MGRVGKPSACPKCGVRCETAREAWRHCLRRYRELPIASFTCRWCGAVCGTARAAWRHCQGSGEWHNYESIERRLRRACDAVRADPFTMRDIRAVAEALLDLVI